MAIAEVIHSGLFDNLPEFVRKREGAVGQKRIPYRTRDLIDAAEYSCFHGDGAGLQQGNYFSLCP